MENNCRATSTAGQQQASYVCAARKEVSLEKEPECTENAEREGKSTEQHKHRVQNQILGSQAAAAPALPPVVCGPPKIAASDLLGGATTAADGRHWGSTATDALDCLRLPAAGAGVEAAAGAVAGEKEKIDCRAAALPPPSRLLLRCTLSRMLAAIATLARRITLRMPLSRGGGASTTGGGSSSEGSPMALLAARISCWRCSSFRLATSPRQCRWIRTTVQATEKDMCSSTTFPAPCLFRKRRIMRSSLRLSSPCSSCAGYVIICHDESWCVIMRQCKTVMVGVACRASHSSAPPADWPSCSARM